MIPGMTMKMNTGFFKYLLTCLFIALSFISITHAQEPPDDLTGVWQATTPEGRFTILSLTNRDTGSGYYFLMLKPGEIELDFGFDTGELLATLTDLQGNCWLADERFRFPLWAGGGFYMGETEYCLTDDDDILNFHTDDEAAVFADYPLERIADPIESMGLWHCAIPEMDFDIILYPVDDSEWEALFVSSDYDAAGEADLVVTDILYRGDEAPDSDGVDASAAVWGTIHTENPIWLPMVVTLEDSNTLVFLISQGPELERIEIEYKRVY